MSDFLNAGTLWFVLGATLMLAELTVPGFILIFFGGGAWVTAFTAWFGLTPSTVAQLAVFLFSSVLLLVILRRYGGTAMRGRQSRQAAPHDDFMGQRAVVVEGIEPNGMRGKVELHGTAWNADADTAIPAGVSVVVTGREGLTLKVRPLAS